MPVVDIHTHMISENWLALLEGHGGRYGLLEVTGGQRAISVEGAPFMTLTPGMLDYPQRIARMDAAGVDVAVISLTCPSVFWGGPEVSVKAARSINDDMATAERQYPGRLRWLATLPWQYPAEAVEELVRSVEAGAVGVMAMANVAGTPLTEPLFAPIWEEIDRRSLPVLVHPTVPPGVESLAMTQYNLVGSVGFAFDTTLAIARMVLDGFFDRYPGLKVVASHGGGALPYVAGRIDQWYRSFEACRERISTLPSTYLGRLYYDAVVYTRSALDLCIELAGPDHVMYGSDYPHNVGDMAGCLERVDSLPAGVATRVRGANAAQVFRL